MLKLNSVMLVGRLTRDPETKQTQGGTALTKFSIAVNRNRKDPKTGERIEEASFFDVTTFSKTAEFVAKFFAKGKAIFVEGRLQQDTWETDGQKRSKVVVVAERASFAESKAEAEASGGGGGFDRSQATTAPKQAAGMQDATGGTETSTSDDLPF